MSFPQELQTLPGFRAFGPDQYLRQRYLTQGWDEMARPMRLRFTMGRRWSRRSCIDR